MTKNKRVWRLKKQNVNKSLLTLENKTHQTYTIKPHLEATTLNYGGKRQETQHFYTCLPYKALNATISMAQDRYILLYTTLAVGYIQNTFLEWWTTTYIGVFSYTLLQKRVMVYILTKVKTRFLWNNMSTDSLVFKNKYIETGNKSS